MLVKLHFMPRSHYQQQLDSGYIRSETIVIIINDKITYYYHLLSTNRVKSSAPVRFTICVWQEWDFLNY